MKLGKKLLSCILAVLMIMSSVTVSFTVFAAAGTKDVLDVIDQYYDDLKEAIDSKDAKRVPSGSSGSNNWTVEVDTYTSAWYYVTRAWYEYAIATKGTYDALYNALVTEATGRAGAGGISLADYKAILGYYNCNPGPRMLVVKSGYDVLAWKTAEAMQADMNRTYHNATFTINYNTTSNAITGGSVDDKGTPSGITGKDGNIDMLSNAIINTRDNFKKWFATDFSTLTIEQLLALVDPTDQASCGQALTTFNNAVVTASQMSASLSGNAEKDVAAIWNHYIKPDTGYTYSQAQEWMENDLMANLYKAYAASYKAEFDKLMAVDLLEKNSDGVYVMTADKVLEHYNAVKAKMYELESKQSPIDATVNIFEFINGHFKSDYNDYYDKTVKDYVYNLEETLAKRYVVGPYDNGEKPWADQLTELINEEPEVPTYDHSDEAAIEAWQSNAEGQAAARAYIGKATTLLTKIDEYITKYVPFDDDRYTGDTGVKSALSPVQKQNIDADRYNTLKALLDKHKLDVEGYDTFMLKAKMDALMKTTILDGRRTGDMTAFYEEFSGLVNGAKKKRDSTNETDKAIYNEVFPSKTDADGNTVDGLAVYEAYLITIKERVARRLYEQVQLVLKYAGEGGSGKAIR